MVIIFFRWLALYNDPHGETVFTNSNLFSGVLATDKETIDTLRKMIRELEHQNQVSPSSNSVSGLVPCGTSHGF